MALYIGSLLLVLGATAYLMAAGIANRITAIALMFLASAALGFLLIETLDYRLGLAAGIAGLSATALGMAHIRRYGAATAVNAAVTGWLGAALGLFAGSRFYVTNAVMIGADIAFVALAFLLQKAAERYSREAAEPGKQTQPAKQTEPGKQTQPGKPANRRKEAARKAKRASSAVPASAMYAAAVAVLASVLLSHADSSNADRIGQASSADAVYDLDNGVQTATVEVNGAGFNPRNINLRSDVMVRLVFHVSSLAADDMTFVSKDLNLEAPLRKGDNIFMIKKALPGVYGFTVRGSNASGTFTVKAAS
ncbi:hypothetical protein GXP70_04970 [Paenibacillus lycopersici]|uniref:EfeO-type cupredoxin-like domain-containing protein n=1 Tax=Paenibacillus lycopersici TaxID=2704462 RepID=A0A6C0FVR4_9BACL|nr:cupredoxin domain-containing protein [Paenibacillus lycopersici]QHT59384.1 hypothetical protein GXP70_04970 [Paenibacillus lycopersici]